MKRSEPLSAEVLTAMRASKGHPRSLPVMPPKEFVPTNTEAERDCILGLVETELSFIKEERAEKRCALSVAEWDPNEGLAVVKHKTGIGWDIYGFEKGGCCYLLPEEALFMLEVSRLELWFSGIPVSVQQAYQLLLKKDLCSLEQYKVYAHLNRLGYRLIKVDPEESIELKKESSYDSAGPQPKRAKLDGPPLHRKPRSAIAARERHYAIQQHVNAHFMPVAATAEDFDLIPNFAGQETTISVHFPWPDLLPEGLQDRLPNYTLDKSKFPISKDNETIDLGMPARPRAKNWEDYEKFSLIPEFDQDNHPLYQGRITPLLNGDFSGGVLSRLDIVGSAVKETEDSYGADDDFPICYSVYSPSRRFRKSDPGSPCYYLAVATKTALLPKLSSLTRMRRACSPNTKGLIAITGAGADVSFFELKEAMTPFRP